jgi:protein-tyrosine-phosphatase
VSNKDHLEGFVVLEDVKGQLLKLAEKQHLVFRGKLSLETIEQYVFESYALLDKSSEIKIYLPSLAERFSRDRLQALLKIEQVESSDVKDVLFVCVHNSGRSQMAAGFMSNLGGERVVVRSAGSAPKESISLIVVEAMAEVGIDISLEYPKPLTEEVVRAADAVITMGCGDACPVYPGKRYEDWVLDDPAGQGIDSVRIIRDEIKQRVEHLLSELFTVQEL